MPVNFNRITTQAIAIPGRSGSVVEQLTLEVCDGLRLHPDGLLRLGVVVVLPAIWSRVLCPLGSLGHQLRVQLPGGGGGGGSAAAKGIGNRHTTSI